MSRDQGMTVAASPRWGRYLLAGFFLFAGMTKAHFALVEFRPPSVLGVEMGRAAVGMAAALEILLGCALILRPGVWINRAASTVLALFLVLSTLESVSIPGDESACGCFGHLEVSANARVWLSLGAFLLSLSLHSPARRVAREHLAPREAES